MIKIDLLKHHQQKNTPYRPRVELETQHLSILVTNEDKIGDR